MIEHKSGSRAEGQVYSVLLIAFAFLLSALHNGTSLCNDRLSVEESVPHPPTGGANSKESLALIDQLQSATEKTVFFTIYGSTRRGGEVFAPVPLYFLTDPFGPGPVHEVKPGHEAFTRLIELGPVTIPILLDALEDFRPTEIRVGPSGPRTLGGTVQGWPPPLKWNLQQKDRWRGPRCIKEINPRNVKEALLLKEPRWSAVPKDVRERTSTHIGQYTIRVGDLCYAVLGQICNRFYGPVEYQPTGVWYIYSPAKEKAWLNDLRTLWGDENPRKMLFDSLVFDFEDNWSFSVFRAGAALRLTFYYPEESEELLLKGLDRVGMFEDRESRKFDAKLIEALYYSKSERIHEKIREIGRTTSDPWLFTASLRAIPKEDTDLVVGHMKEFAVSIPGEWEVWHGGEGYLFLKACVKLYPEHFREVCTLVAQRDDLHSIDVLCTVLQYNAFPWKAELLAPLLDDKRAYGDRRVCDRAAQAIAENIDGLLFKWTENVGERDRQIEKIKAALREEYKPNHVK